MKRPRNKAIAIAIIGCSGMLLFLGCSSKDIDNEQAITEEISWSSMEHVETELLEADIQDNKDEDSNQETLEESIDFVTTEAATSTEQVNMTIQQEESYESSQEDMIATDDNLIKHEQNETEMQAVQDIENDDFVSKLSISEQTKQLIIVSATGNTAVVSMHQKEETGWNCILETNAQIGENGVGKTKEGDRKTPKGVYTMSFAFGNKDNPGTALPYTRTDDSWYWVDDGNSQFYNQFVTTNQVTCDWTSAEHIAAVSKSYNYVIPIDYNTSRTTGLGSAIFLHCKPSGGAGCIAISEDAMITVLQHIQPGCLIVIDTEEQIASY